MKIGVNPMMASQSNAQAIDMPNKSKLGDLNDALDCVSSVLRIEQMDSKSNIGSKFPQTASLLSPLDHKSVDFGDEVVSNEEGNDMTTS